MLNRLMALFTPGRKVEMKTMPTGTDNRITDCNNKHVIYQWHGDSYMDLKGNVYTVTKKFK